MFKTTDEGTHWSALNSGLTTRILNALAMDPQDPSTLYAAMDLGVFKTTDGGTSWTLMSSGLPTFGPGYYGFEVLAIDPQNSGTLYVGTDAGVFKSLDGGADWMAATSGLTENFGVNVLAIDPQDPNTIYAGGGGSFQAGTLFKSTDGGTTWATSGLPSGYIVSTLVIDPQNSTTLFTIVNYPADGKIVSTVLKSTDGGANWSMTNWSVPVVTCISTLAIDPQVTRTLYVAPCGGGVFRSTDGGVNWSAVNSGLTPLSVSALAIDAGNPNSV